MENLKKYGRDITLENVSEKGKKLITRAIYLNRIIHYMNMNDMRDTCNEMYEICENAWDEVKNEIDMYSYQLDILVKMLKLKKVTSKNVEDIIEIVSRETIEEPETIEEHETIEEIDEKISAIMPAINFAAALKVFYENNAPVIEYAEKIEKSALKLIKFDNENPNHIISWVDAVDAAWRNAENVESYEESLEMLQDLYENFKNFIGEMVDIVSRETFNEIKNMFTGDSYVDEYVYDEDDEALLDDDGLELENPKYIQYAETLELLKENDLDMQERRSVINDIIDRLTGETSFRWHYCEVYDVDDIDMIIDELLKIVSRETLIKILKETYNDLYVRALTDFYGEDNFIVKTMKGMVK